jgi:hypothetical protein
MRGRPATAEISVSESERTPSAFNGTGIAECSARAEHGADHRHGVPGHVRDLLVCLARHVARPRLRWRTRASRWRRRLTSGAVSWRCWSSIRCSLRAASGRQASALTSLPAAPVVRGQGDDPEPDQAPPAEVEADEAGTSDDERQHQEGHDDDPGFEAGEAFRLGRLGRKSGRNSFAPSASTGGIWLCS